MMNPTAVFLVSLISLTITLEGLLAIWEVGHTTLTFLPSSCQRLSRQATFADVPTLTPGVTPTCKSVLLFAKPADPFTKRVPGKAADEP